MICKCLDPHFVGVKTGQKLDLSSSDQTQEGRGETKQKRGEEGGSVIMACQ